MDLIERLKTTLQERQLAVAQEDTFDLLSAACSQCCSQFEGGNKTCPPPPKLAEEVFV